MDRELTRQRIASYTFFSYIFFTLPNADFIAKIMALPAAGGDSDEGSVLLQKYVRESQGKEVEALMTELGIDRTQLLRGLTKHGARPPYESLYIQAIPQDIIGALNKAYAQKGYSVVRDVRESSEYIGVEINFMQLLCEQELTALERDEQTAAEEAQQKQIEFFTKHLGRWAVAAAEEMLKFAKTDFYRAIALLLRDFMQDEADYLCAEE